MNCDCITKIDDKLREKNLRLAGYALVGPSYKAVPSLHTEWIDREQAPKGKKNSPPAMLGSHCPFCGLPCGAETEKKAT